jgi:microcin C transport system permease protein
MFRFSPATIEKFQRFRRIRRAWISFLLLSGIFVISLVSELIAHGTPWMVRFEGKTYFPRIQTVARDVFLSDGVMTEPDYRLLQENHELFGDGTENWMLWAPIRFSPEGTVRPEQIELEEVLEVQLQRRQRVTDLRVSSRGATRPGLGFEWFSEQGADELPPELRAAMELRFQNMAAPALSVPHPSGAFAWSLSAYEPRSRAPRSVRLVLRERIPDDDATPVKRIPVGDDIRPDWWASLPQTVQEEAEAAMEEALTVPVNPIEFTDDEGVRRAVVIRKETVQFPFRPVRHHPLGLDQSGRDVLVLILYATRISLLFGFILVICSMVIGTVLGGIQGYIGGKVDLFAQRIIEIYSSIPFLYAMIFLGSVFGRSFGLLLFVYAIFNWIGISYYMRAEFLRLRRQPFTEAAQSLGLSTGRIMWRHILPNSLIPIITFFPFSLVGAVGSLSALDYLGFGLPVGTPSWGDLLSQGQNYRYAWWLILYPSAMLFVVILLSVFIGEGLRTAFDPKREVRWDA